MATSTLQVVVTGGAGQIAYSLIPLIARGLVFGPATRVHLRLLDIPPAAKALEGVAMEVQDSLFSTALDGVVATTDEGKAFDGAQVAILLGGFPRRPGMERGDLIGKNAGIMKRMGEALELYACRNCKVIVVANPAPTNCVVLASHAPSLPRKNISCLSRLDHDRMVGMLLKEANTRLAGGGQRLGPADVRGVCVWGNHSNSQVPDASGAEFFVNGRWAPAAAIVGNSGWLDLPSSNPQNLGRASPTSSSSSSSEGVSLAEAVRTRGAAVLTARKLSSAMSAANAIAGHLADWLAPAGSAPIAQVVSMGVTTDGNPFGVPEGLFCSFPVFCIGGGDWKFAEGFELTDEAGRQLDASVQELKEEKAMTVDMMGGGDAAVAPTTSPPTPGLAPVQPNGTPISSL